MGCQNIREPLYGLYHVFILRGDSLTHYHNGLNIPVRPYHLKWQFLISPSKFYTILSLSPSLPAKYHHLHMTTCNKSLTLDTQFVLKQVVTFVATALLTINMFVLLEPLAKLRKRPLDLSCHVCPCVRPSICMEQLILHWTNSHEILIFEYFSKICRKNSRVINLKR